jgi:uncharacterized protein DUF6653
MSSPMRASDPSGGASPGTGEGRVARLFGLEGEKWMRHANPLSVWTRFSVVPLLAVSIWSREWLGWFSLIPIALSVLWMMVNPLVFPRPRSTKNWASKAVFGERIWVEQNKVEIPEQFKSAVPNLANTLSAGGLALMAFGLVTLDVLSVAAGMVIGYGGKLWYLDRMVLLFEHMKTQRAEYAEWEY